MSSFSSHEFYRKAGPCHSGGNLDDALVEMVGESLIQALSKLERRG